MLGRDTEDDIFERACQCFPLWSLPLNPASSTFWVKDNSEAYGAPLLVLLEILWSPETKDYWRRQREGDW